MSADKIPIRNIYFLLCYAWGHLQETRYADIRTENCDRIWDMLAKVLIRSTQQLIKRGLHRDYVPLQERRARLRGKVLFSAEARRPIFGSPQRLCEFDELSADVLPNRVIRSTLGLLLRHRELDSGLHDELRSLAGFFAPFTPLHVEPQHFRRVQLHRNMQHYRFVLCVCEFIHAQALPSPETGAARFRDFLRDEARMGHLFENFVLNFYRSEQSKFGISSPRVDWLVDTSRSSPAGLELLPEMKTDVCLDDGDRKLILDCKFYLDAFQRNHGVPKFRSAHLYQLLTYLKNQSAVPGWETVEGLLLYPTVEQPFDERLHLQGHTLRLVSLDLHQHWSAISADLLDLLPTSPAAVPSL